MRYYGEVERDLKICPRCRVLFDACAFGATIEMHYAISKDLTLTLLCDDVLRQEIATRSELTKVANPPDIAAVFDYTITRKNYAQLKAAGWQPAR